MFKYNLRKLLFEHDWTQAELSRKSKVGPNTINAIYHGYAKRVNIDDLNALCNALNCTLNDIMEHIPDEE